MGIRVFEGQHVWRVGVSLPKDETKGRKWAQTKQLVVVASTAEAAIACSRTHYGECSVWSVQHHVGSDSEIVVAEEALR